jgi:hypothetical protein
VATKGIKEETHERFAKHSVIVGTRKTKFSEVDSFLPFEVVYYFQQVSEQDITPTPKRMFTKGRADMIKLTMFAHVLWEKGDSIR